MKKKSPFMVEQSRDGTDIIDVSENNGGDAVAESGLLGVGSSRFAPRNLQGSLSRGSKDQIAPSSLDRSTSAISVLGGCVCLSHAPGARTAG